MKVTRVTARGDTLIILGEQGKQEYKAVGWLSATMNHYDASAYKQDGHRKASAKPRAMTKEEKLAYYERLLFEQNQLEEEIEVFNG